MFRRVLVSLAALTVAGILGTAPAAMAAGPTVTVGPVTINGNPGCC